MRKMIVTVAALVVAALTLTVAQQRPAAVKSVRLSSSRMARFAASIPSSSTSLDKN
jgi:hypothetical protein